MNIAAPLNISDRHISDKRGEIMQAAADAFARKGYRATSMRTIAAAVQLEVSSLYSHIQSKQEMLQYICAQSAEAYAKGMSRICGELTEPLDQLSAVIDLHVEMALEHPASMLVHTDEWKHLEEPVREKFLAERRTYEKQLTSIINRGIDQKQIRDISPYIIVQSLLASFTWLYRKSGRIDPGSVCVQLSELWLKGIKNN